MVKLLGCTLLGAGCAWLGFRAAAQMRRRVRQLSDAAWALEVMQREITLRCTPVPELLALLAARQGPGESLFSRCGRHLEEGGGMERAWDLALEESGFSHGDAGVLRPLGCILGRYDSEGQAGSIAGLRSELDRRLEQARQEAGRLGRVYGTLGVAGGMFLILMLL